MRKKIYLLAIVSILGLSVFLAVKQLIADSYCRMADHDGRDLNKAIGYLEKCVGIDSKRSLPHFFLGRAYLRKGLAGGAKQGEKNKWVRRSTDEFHKAMELEPSNSDYHFHLAMSYGCMTYPPRVYWDAIQDSFHRTAMLNPTDVRHLYLIGSYYLEELRRFEIRAQAYEGNGPVFYEKYKELLKNNYRSYFKKALNVDRGYMGKILTKSFSVTQEYTDLKAIIRDTPYDHAFLARFLDSKGMWKEAKAEYRKAIHLEPTNPNHYSSLGYVLYRRGDFEKAIYWWQKQKRLDDRDQRAYLLLADCFVNLKRFDDALQELRDLIKLNPEDINYQLKLIRTLLAVGRFDEAVSEYHKILQKNPHLSKETYDAISQYRKRKDYRKLTKALNGALLSIHSR